MQLVANTPESPGVLIRKAREALGISQEKLAQAAGMSSRTVLAHIERGSNQLSTVEQREAVAKGFGVSPADLKRLLGGTISVEDFVAVARESAPGVDVEPSSASARAPNRFVELDDVYPGRAEAIALVGDRFPENVIRSVKMKRLKDGDEDKGREFWIEQILDAHRSFQRWQRKIDDDATGDLEHDGATPTVSGKDLESIARGKKLAAPPGEPSPKDEEASGMRPRVNQSEMKAALSKRKR